MNGRRIRYSQTSHLGKACSNHCDTWRYNAGSGKS